MPEAPGRGRGRHAVTPATMDSERTFDPDRLDELVRNHLFAGPEDEPDPRGFVLAVRDHPELCTDEALHQLTVWRKQQQLVMSPYNLPERLKQLADALAAECNLPLPDERTVALATIAQTLAPLRRAPADATHDPTYLIFLAETAREVLYAGLYDGPAAISPETMTDAAELLVLCDRQPGLTYVSDLLNVLDAPQAHGSPDLDTVHPGNELALRAGLLRGWAHRGMGVEDPDALVDRIEEIGNVLLSETGQDDGQAAELVPAIVHLSIQLQETHRATASALVNRAALACGVLAQALGQPLEASVNLVGYLYDCYERTGDPTPLATAVEVGLQAAADAGTRVDLPVLQLHSNIAHVLRHQARLHADRGDRQLARQDLDEAVRHATHAVEHSQDQQVVQRATFLLSLAAALHERATLFGRPGDLLGVALRSEEAVSELLAAERDDSEVLQTRADLLRIAAMARRHLAGAGPAEPLAREAHKEAKGKKERIATAKELAHVLGELGEHRGAERLLREATTDATAVVAEANAAIDVRATVRLLADLPSNLAIELVDQDAPEDAAVVLDGVRPWYRRLAGGQIEQQPPEGRAGARLYIGAGRRGCVAILADGGHTVERADSMDESMLETSFTRFHQAELQWVNAIAAGTDLASNVKRFAGEVERLCEITGRIVEPLASRLEYEELTIVPSGPTAGLPWIAAMVDGVRIFADTDVTLSFGSPAERHHRPTEPTEITEAYWPPSLRPDRPTISSSAVRSVTRADVDGLLQVLGTDSVGALHLVCHGIYDRANPLQSFLALAPDASVPEGGRLTLDELSRNPVRTPIINLMACQTGAPDHRLFDQGLSFPSALLARGASSVLAPLWSLHLEVAEVFSRAFFTELTQGVPSARAFRLGIEATRAAARRDGPKLAGISAASLQSERAADAFPPSEHPYWWAAMTHVGASVRIRPRPL